MNMSTTFPPEQQKIIDAIVADMKQRRLNLAQIHAEVLASANAERFNDPLLIATFFDSRVNGGEWPPKSGMQAKPKPTARKPLPKKPMPPPKGSPGGPPRPGFVANGQTNKQPTDRNDGRGP
jgi:hypothetical protein